MEDAVDAGKAPDEAAEKKRAYDASLQRIENHEPGARAAYIAVAAKEREDARARRPLNRREEVLWEPPTTATFNWNVLRDNQPNMQRKNREAKDARRVDRHTFAPGHR